MAFRFVHTADVHLDLPLRTLALREPELAELIGGATRKAFATVVDLCLAERVDALLVAGDLYDGEQTSMKTARFLAEQLRRLHDAGVSSFIIRGNHDAESRITRELTLPDSVKVFGGRAEAVSLSRGALDVAVHGVSFAQKHAPENLLPPVPSPSAGRGQHRHAAHEPQRLAGPRSLRSLRARRVAWVRLSVLGARPHPSALRRARACDNRHAGQSAGARRQRSGAQVRLSRDDRRRWRRRRRRATDERCGVPARRGRSRRRGGVARAAPPD